MHEAFETTRESARAKGSAPTPDDHDPDLINGVYVPPEVQRQLTAMGVNPRQLNKGQLEDVLVSFAPDARVNDDPHGVNLADKLVQTPEEADRAARRASLPYASPEPARFQGFHDDAHAPKTAWSANFPPPPHHGAPHSWQDRVRGGHGHPEPGYSIW